MSLRRCSPKKLLSKTTVGTIIILIACRHCILIEKFRNAVYASTVDNLSPDQSEIKISADVNFSMKEIGGYIFGNCDRADVGVLILEQANQFDKMELEI